MPSPDPRWLDIVRHRIRGVRAPYLLMLQHHDIPSSTRIAAPITPNLPGDTDRLAPRLTIDGQTFRARLLDMTAIPRTLLAETIATAQADADAIMSALDVILHGYPIGRPV